MACGAIGARRRAGDVSDPRVGAVAERVREARSAGTPLRVVGRGAWLDAGAPVVASHRLDVGGLGGIVEYEPGDLTLTAMAGTPLADLQAAAAAHGQWLPLDPPGPADGSLGATIATASWGPLASAFGTPRDQVLGCEVVTGAGTIVRAGGRVVKNVAGFDLTRLMTGAWGTLGVITEATVRLRARPEVDETVAVALGGAAAVEHACRWLRTTEFTPMAAELLSAALARRLEIAQAGDAVLLVRAGGNAALVRAFLHSAAMLGALVPVAGDLWSRLSAADAEHATLRASVAPARVAPLWQALAGRADALGGAAHATLRRGTVRCILPPDAVAPLLDEASRCNATVVGERGPEVLWSRGSADPVLQRLAGGVRRAFDPDGVLNPGIMGASAGVVEAGALPAQLAAGAAPR